MRTAVYIRVSTVDQNSALQREELEQYIQARGWTLAGTYEDTMSGAKSARPGLNRLLNDAAARRFDAVIVWKLDRFGRSLVDCLSHVQTLERHGCASWRLRKAWILTRTIRPADSCCTFWRGGGVRAQSDSGARARRHQGREESRQGAGQAEAHLRPERSARVAPAGDEHSRDLAASERGNGQRHKDLGGSGMKIPTKDEQRREYFRRIGRKGGKIGGKRSLETMTQAARTARAYKGGKQRRKVDRAQVVVLRKAGMTGREIAAELGVSEVTVWRKLAEAKPKC